MSGVKIKVDVHSSPNSCELAVTNCWTGMGEMDYGMLYLTRVA